MDKKEFLYSYEIILKANEALKNKVIELQDYLQNSITLINDKETNKYYNISKSLKAMEYKNNYENNANIFKLKYFKEIENLNSENSLAFLKKLTNNYAKLEDEYHDVLSLSKNPEITASLLFKCECKLNYILNIIENIKLNDEIKNIMLNNLEDLTK